MLDVFFCTVRRWCLVLSESRRPGTGSRAAGCLSVNLKGYPQHVKNPHPLLEATAEAGVMPTHSQVT